ncbi:hypothetical protein QAD02_005047 [Eretmocerus hayati]|uniref:Uncharacterized protein n=1 Tax=Eretmocerus hayati TaxID=131215 RepID=A0ACC2NW60_9HYME|nr:hypothetical protein QAD02_005047 [Eretmocerus hayati]
MPKAKTPFFTKKDLSGRRIRKQRVKAVAKAEGTQRSRPRTRSSVHLADIAAQDQVVGDLNAIAPTVPRISRSVSVADLPREDPVPIIPVQGELCANPDDAEDEHAPVDAEDEHASVDAEDEHAPVDAEDEHASVDAEPNEPPEIDIAEDEQRWDVVSEPPAPEVVEVELAVLNEIAEPEAPVVAAYQAGVEMDPGDGVPQEPPRARGQDAPEAYDEGVGGQIHNPALVPEGVEAVILRVLREQRLLDAPQGQAPPQEQEEVGDMGLNPEPWNNLPPMVFSATLRECHELIARQRALIASKNASNRRLLQENVGLRTRCDILQDQVGHLSDALVNNQIAIPQYQRNGRGGRGGRGGGYGFYQNNRQRNHPY